MLTGDLENVSMVPRQLFDECHGGRLLNEIPLARKIAREPPGDRRGDAHKFCINERGTCYSIAEIGQKRPDAQRDQAKGHRKPDCPVANEALEVMGNVHVMMRPASGPRGKSQVFEKRAPLGAIQFSRGYASGLLQW